MGSGVAGQDVFVTARVDAARKGQVAALYDLGVAYSVGDHGVDVDLIEAHKWFNLAALRGDRRAQIDRAEIAGEMSAAEIATAQRSARDWMRQAA
jgi:uncharacterized protein